MVGERRVTVAYSGIVASPEVSQPPELLSLQQNYSNNANPKRSGAFANPLSSQFTICHVNTITRHKSRMSNATDVVPSRNTRHAH